MDSEAESMRALVVAHTASGDTGPLDQALAVADSVFIAQAWASSSAGTRAGLLTLAAAAAQLRSRSSAAAPDDFDRAVTWLTEAVATWPPDDPNLPGTQSNLAGALNERYERTRDQVDLDRALSLSELAIAGLERHERRTDVAVHIRGLIFHNRAEAGHPHKTADFDSAADAFRMAAAADTGSAIERAGYLNSLGMVLASKARHVADPALYEQAIAVYEQAREMAGARVRMYWTAALNQGLSMLAHADLTNDVGTYRNAADLYAHIAAGSQGEDREKAVVNQACALFEVYRHTRQQNLLTEAVSVLSTTTRDENSRRGTAMANLAAAIHELHGHTGRIALADRTVELLESTATTQDIRDERLLNLGIAVFRRYERRGAPGDLTRATELLTEAAACDSPDVRGSALNSCANIMSVRYQLTSQRTWLDRAIELRHRAIVITADGSAAMAMYRGNLGVDLLNRYGATNDPADLDAALGAQRQALQDTPLGAAPHPELLAGLAETLITKADVTATETDIAAARSAFDEAISSAMASLPGRALANAIVLGDWEARNQRWAMAADAYNTALAILARLVGVQRMRTDKESWLIDALGLPAKAAYANARAGAPTKAVTAVDHGRAMLLAEELRARK